MKRVRDVFMVLAFLMVGASPMVAGDDQSEIAQTQGYEFPWLAFSKDLPVGLVVIPHPDNQCTDGQSALNVQHSVDNALSQRGLVIERSNPVPTQMILLEHNGLKDHERGVCIGNIDISLMISAKTRYPVELGEADGRLTIENYWPREIFAESRMFISDIESFGMVSSERAVELANHLVSGIDVYVERARSKLDKIRE